MKNFKNSGFSLIELSIVLLIIGLIVAAVASGTHILHTAKLNKVISEIRGYATGVENFRNKYNYWPGDLPNATSYWGIYNASTNPTGVVNGNGSEVVEDSEGFQAWSHLAKAQFIVGDYDGTGATLDDYVVGVNVPAGQAIENSHYLIKFRTIYDTSGAYLLLKQNRHDGVLTPEDVYYIDKKIDDGDNGISSATTGNVYGFKDWDIRNDATKCTSAWKFDPSANYVLNDFDPNCRVVYWLEKD